jgi:hypothetical protein
LRTGIRTYFHFASQPKETTILHKLDTDFCTPAGFSTSPFRPKCQMMATTNKRGEKIEQNNFSYRLQLGARACASNDLVASSTSFTRLLAQLELM